MSDLEAIIETGAAAAVEIAASAMAERGHEVHPCPNCGKPMIGAYCAICGQERDTHRRSVWGLIHALMEDIISFDSRVLRTAYALVARPGEIASAFREGRPRRYVPALRLYFFVSLIFFVVLGLSNIAIMQLVVTATPVKIVWIKGEAYVPNPSYDPADPDTHFMPKMMKMSKERAAQPGGHFEYSTKVYFFAPIGAHQSELTPEARAKLGQNNFDVEVKTLGKEDAAKKKRAVEIKSWIERHVYDGLQRLAADPAALNGPLTTWIPRVLFLLVPLYAALLALFYIRQRRKFFYVDHLIFSLSIHSFGFVLLMLAAGAAQIFSGGNVALGTFVVAGLYTLIATRNFYRQSWFWTVLKFVLVSFFYVVFFVLPALGAVIALSFLNV
ncbi:MAG: DUF3667 domain-containing protein [Alphaproteobacteria bacterium]|nr:DUF3667 domain-containing protein [Alphaproteobacteria bacterium]MBV9693721.1 DUF3667 domain-containing protein [Alphaproteobacteria bacterium]